MPWLRVDYKINANQALWLVDTIPTFFFFWLSLSFPGGYKMTLLLSNLGNSEGLKGRSSVCPPFSSRVAFKAGIWGRFGESRFSHAMLTWFFKWGRFGEFYLCVAFLAEEGVASLYPIFFSRSNLLAGERGRFGESRFSWRNRLLWVFRLSLLLAKIFFKEKNRLNSFLKSD